MIKVRKKNKTNKREATDIHLLVSSFSTEIEEIFDSTKIIDALENEANLDRRLGGKVAKAVEALLIKSEAKLVSSTLIRALIDNVLFEMGLDKQLKKQQIIGLPTADINELIFNKSVENSNIVANNPEAVNFIIAETVLKQYALQNVFSKDTVDFHMSGAGHIHDLSAPHRLYCSSHPIAFVAKFGLDGFIETLLNTSSPAKHASTLTGHLQTFLSFMSAYFAGALGVGFMNVFYAPYLKGMSYEEIKQQVQYLWFSSSQTSYGRGSQNLFLDYGIELGMPEFFMDTDAIGPGGKHVGKYKDYQREAHLFSKAVLELIVKGDKSGLPFAFPKANISVTAKAFEDKQQRELLGMMCEAASINGSPNIIFSRSDTQLSQCCRLKFDIPDKSVFKQPEKIRFVGFGNVTTNLPQAAYRGKGKIDKTIEEIHWAMEMGMKAHMQKKHFVEKLMKKKGDPLWQLSKISPDGSPYTDLSKSSYILGMNGLNECVKRITGQELHESTDSYKTGMKLISSMYLKCQDLSKEHGVKVTLEESPAESASYRLAKVDMMNFAEAKDYVIGDKTNCYYTNSIHYRADAPVSIVERMQGQSKFHPLIESGAIVHAFVGDQKPNPKAIESLVEKTFKNTMCTQMTVSPEITLCNDCHTVSPGIDLVEE